MGWNPWNAFRTDVDEAKILKMASVMVHQGLAKAGYRYINIDDGWWLKRGPDGTLQVRTNIFPSARTHSAQTSFRPFADKLHAMGLKAGIYSDVGRNVCSQAWDANSPNLPMGSQPEREVGSFQHV